MNETHIQSLRNPALKLAVSLRQRKARSQYKKFLVEGVREIDRANSCGFKATEVFYCQNYLSEQAIKTLARLKAVAKVFRCEKDAFGKLAMREQSDGLIVCFERKTWTLEDISQAEESLIVIADSIEKPGNLGALLRSADGSGCRGLLLTGNSVEVFNPNVIRASLGTVFSTPVVQVSEEQALVFLKEQGYTSYGAILDRSSENLYKTKFQKKSAIVLGSEAFGLTEFWRKFCDHRLVIPMLGVSDSLNVSVAGGILMYEYLRQDMLV